MIKYSMYVAVVAILALLWLSLGVTDSQAVINVLVLLISAILLEVCLISDKLNKK